METNLDSNEPTSEPVVHSTPSESASGSVNPPSTEVSQEEVEGKNKGKRKKTEDENAQPDNKRSGVWQHFTKDKEDPNYAICDYCSRSMKCPSKNGTSALHNHLARCKQYPYNIDEKQKLLFFKNEPSVQNANGEGSSFVPLEFKQEVCEQYLAKMIIRDELPFKTVEHEGFRDFVNMLQPRFKIPSRPTITQGCMELYKSVTESMKKYFAKSKQRVSLTTDLWSSRQNLSYMCLTVHFIDHDWTLHKRLLNFCPISGHSGEIIGKYVEKNLLDWGIDKVLTVTVDNASSNDLCLRYLKRRLNIWNKSVLESEHLHMRCSAHILSLVVKEGLKEVDGSIVRIRSAVKYVRSSPARLQRFKECMEKAKIKSKSLLCLDIETRWNSTYLMLESSIKFQSAFDLLEEQDSKYRTELLSSKDMPTKEDWLLSEEGNANAMDVDDDPATFLSNQYKKELEQTSPNSSTKTELERYLAVQCEPIGSNLDLLGWWKKNEPRFPIMAAMARDILAIPSSTVASESAFSTGGRVLDAFRSSLTPNVVEALVCTQNWLRSKNVPMDIEENLEDLEAYEAGMTFFSTFIIIIIIVIIIILYITFGILELKNLPQALSNITVND